MEKEVAQLRMNLYESEDEIDVKKEGLLDEIEQRLHQKTERKLLFTIKWSLV